MNCHERTTAALSLQQPDRVPVFSCTEVQNQVYEILGEEGGMVPLSFVQEGLVGLLLKRAAPLVNGLGIFNREFEKFMFKKVAADVAMGYDCTWVMYSAIFDLRDNRQAMDMYGRLYDLVADADGNLDTPMYREGLLTTPEKWDAWPHPDPDRFHQKIERVFTGLQNRFGEQIYLMGSVCWGLWENATQVMGLPAFAVAMRRDPDFVRRMVRYYETLYLAAVHAAADAGMPGFVYSDDMGHKTGPQTSPRVLDEFFGPSLRRIADQAHQRGLKIIIHSCGNVSQLLDLFVACGFDGVHSLEPTAGMDLADVKRRVGDRMCVFGNLDIAHVLSHGTSQEVEQAVTGALRAAARDGGFIMAMTNSHHAVKVENTRWMIEFTHRYGTYPLMLG
ncbi:MAG TPA: uroporphyrinogen decarboxylase family protein [Anaerolineae bacterium]|nr:uroporphyrinogen decarboxylase family protein [Anaerolineae bacterium]